MAESRPGPSKALTLLTLLVNVISMGVLIGILALLVRLHATLKDMHDEFGGGNIAVQLVTENGFAFGTRSRPIYVEAAD